MKAQPDNDRVSTGVEGLDAILGGGLPRNRIYLLEGRTGTGKTTLALQFLLDGVRHGERGLYITLSETKEELIAVAKSHGWSLDDIVIYDLAVPEKDVVPNSHIPASYLHGFIALSIGAAHNTKKLPLHKLKELCGLIEHPIILLGGIEDIATGSEIAATDPIKIYNACGKFNLNESADLIKKSKLVIAHDTGLMHIAAAFKKPIISVWGNTVTRFGMWPYYGNSEHLNSKFEIQNLSCRPCSKIGYSKCPLKHFKCMELHSMDKLSATVTNFLKQIKI